MSLPIEEVWVNRKVVKITLKGARNKPGIAAEIFDILASWDINAELIVAGAGERGRTDIAFLVLESDYLKLKEREETLCSNVDAKGIKYEPKVALFVFYGDRTLSRRPGIAAKIFDIFAQAGINIEMVSASVDSISIVIPEDRVDEAYMVLQDTLGVDITEGFGYED